MQLNYQGEENYKSLPGVLLTIIIYTVLVQHFGSSALDVINFSEDSMSKEALVYYDETDSSTYNLLEQKQEFVVGIYN